MLTYKDGSFFLDGNKINIYSGALHYFRVLPELWEDRLQKLKDMGLNTVETYVEWNFHEYKKGVWDFGGWRDVAKFIKTAQKVGLYAIVRPGPYICAERNNGGLPYYLIADKNARVRCYEEKYLERVSEFYRRVLAALAPLQHSKGGNIIAFQIENEYGSFGNDKRYLNFCKDAIIQNGITELLFTSDGTAQYMLTGGTVDGVLPTGNFGSGGRGNFANLKKSAPEGAPMMCAEYWLGWFDYFGGIHHRRPVKTITPDIRFFLENNHNFSLYMFHGGTNFGFSGGANYDGTYRPHTTSYDYDAPLNEWGGYTKKYHALRKLLFEAQGLPLTPLAETAPPKQLKSIEIQKAVPLLSLKRGKPIISTCPITVEEAGGTDGLIIYKHIVKGAYPGSKIHLDGLADYGFVYVNGEFKGKAERNCNGAIAVGDLKKDDVLEVIVEFFGRVNYGHTIDRKGLTNIRIHTQTLFDWEIYNEPLTDLTEARLGKTAERGNTSPKFFVGQFSAEEKQDLLFDTSKYTNGYVWVNGFNLGRFKGKKPKQALYIPAPLIKGGKNEIIIFDFQK